MIRDLKREDIEIVNNIGLLINNNFSTINKTNEVINNSYRKIFVYEDLDLVLGFIEIEIHFDYIDIINFAVEKSYQNKGIGNQLLNYVINCFCDKSIILEVNENNVHAIKLYKDNEFRVINIRKKYYQNDNALIMERSK